MEVGIQGTVHRANAAVLIARHAPLPLPLSREGISRGASPRARRAFANNTPHNACSPTPFACPRARTTGNPPAPLSSSSVVLLLSSFLIRLLPGGGFGRGVHRIPSHTSSQARTNPNPQRYIPSHSPPFLASPSPPLPTYHVAPGLLHVRVPPPHEAPWEAHCPRPHERLLLRHARGRGGNAGPREAGGDQGHAGRGR